LQAGTTDKREEGRKEGDADGPQVLAKASKF
jgi:hypothetical protein